MVKITEFITYLIPWITLAISLIVAYVNTRFKEVKLALRYADLYEKIMAINKRDSNDEIDANRVVEEELKLAMNFYSWKSLRYITTHTRGYFNYIAFIVFIFGFLAIIASETLIDIKDAGVVNPYLLVGAIPLIMALSFMLYTRYNAYLFDRYMFLLKNDKYQRAYIAIHQAKEIVVDEMMIPAFTTFFGLLILSIFINLGQLYSILIAADSAFVIANFFVVYKRSSTTGFRKWHDE